MQTGPTFLGIGAQKAGTTWLHKTLRLHPDIGMPEQKELHFWDRSTLDAASIAGYRQIFTGLHGKARGEITPSYAILPRERIALIKQHLPGLRILYVLRNPMERAWSQAKMELAKLQDRSGGLPDDLGGWFVEQFSSEASMARGDYCSCIRNWRAAYGSDAMKVMVHERIAEDPWGFLQECCRHLGVDTGYYEQADRDTLTEPVYPEQAILKIERMNLPVRPPAEYAGILNELYANQIAETGSLIGIDLSAVWR